MLVCVFGLATPMKLDGAKAYAWNRLDSSTTIDTPLDFFMISVYCYIGMLVC